MYGSGGSDRGKSSYSRGQAVVQDLENHLLGWCVLQTAAHAVFQRHSGGVCRIIGQNSRGGWFAFQVHQNSGGLELQLGNFGGQDCNIPRSLMEQMQKVPVSGAGSLLNNLPLSE